MKLCSCGETNPDNFSPAASKRCKKCQSAATKKYRATEKGKITTRLARRNYKRKQRIKVLDLLGNSCVRCGFADWRALQVDHINGGGSKEDKQITARKILACETEEYQLLCANCNWIKRVENGEVRSLA